MGVEELLPIARVQPQEPCPLSASRDHLWEGPGPHLGALDGVHREGGQMVDDEGASMLQQRYCSGHLHSASGWLLPGQAQQTPLEWWQEAGGRLSCMRAEPGSGAGGSYAH